MKVLAFVVSCVGLIFASAYSYAFKTDTHVWIGQQVIDDVQDGALSFDVNGKTINIAISADVRDTILNNQSFYRMGNIGPDAAPDIVSGQTVIHPGSISNWQSDDWLSWITLQAQTYGAKERAYAYGFQAHAAADVFAHTYVNMYSGGIFQLFDEDINVEKRHVLLESYISRFTPKVASLTLESPNTFLREKMVFNPEVANQYDKTGSAQYLADIYRVRKEIQSVLDSQELKDLEAEMLKAGVYQATGVRIPDALAEDINKGWQEIDNLVDGQIDKAQELADKQNKNLIKLRQYQTDIEINTLDVTQNALVQTINFDVSAVSTVVNLQNSITNTIRSIGEKAASKEECSYLLGVASCKTIAIWADWQDKLWGTVDSLNKQLADEKKRLLNEQILKLKNLSRDTRDVTTSVIASNHQITQNLINFAQRFNGQPIRGFLEGWRNDIDTSITSYIGANAETIKLTMATNSDPTKPIRVWLECSAPSLLGIPAEVPDSICVTKSLIADLNKYMNQLQDLTLSLAGLDKVKEKIDSKILAEINRLKTRLINSVLPKEVKELVEIFSSSPSDTAIDQLFMQEGNAFHLLAIPSMAARVRAEMYLRTDGTFDPKRFAVVRNAITMAKLSLLNAQQLNELAWQAGVAMPSLYGNGLYYNNERIFTRALRSLDGNHQWLESAPPYPRRAGYPDQSTHRFGYAFAYNEGFRIWQDNSARDNLFKKLFIGPIAPGIEAPEILGFSRVLAADYPYESCAANAFPSSANDRTCTVIKILPSILHVLMR